MKKIKIAVIGVGNISNCHIGSYLKNPDVELYAFCDINKETLDIQGKKYGITRLFTDDKEMLATLPEIDAVSVCTWNCAHAECAMDALNAGKDVLCEKPMALNAAQARQMVECAKKNGRKLMVGFVRRFGNDAAVAKDFIKAGNLGEIYYAKATYLRRNGNPGGWFCDKSRSGGGPLIDLGVHVIDLVRYLMGDPKPVAVSGVTYKKLGNRPGIKDKIGYTSKSKKEGEICDVEDFAAALIRFENGAALNVETSFSLNIEKDSGDIALFGTKGGITLSPDFHLYTETNGYLSNVSLAMPTALDFNGLFENEINFFVDAVKNDKDINYIADDGYMLMTILDATYESARLNKEVLIDR